MPAGVQRGRRSSGCTIDRYDRWLALQFTSLGLAQRRDLHSAVLVELLRPAGIYQRTERGIGQLEGLEARDGLVWGERCRPRSRSRKAACAFWSISRKDRKRGFYLDQSRQSAGGGALCAAGGMLDAFCYTGGFGLHAARAGAGSVSGLDQSEPALQLRATMPVEMDWTTWPFVRGDVFDELTVLGRTRRTLWRRRARSAEFARRAHAVERRCAVIGGCRNRPCACSNRKAFWSLAVAPDSLPWIC